MRDKCEVEARRKALIAQDVTKIYQGNIIANEVHRNIFHASKFRINFEGVSSSGEDEWGIHFLLKGEINPQSVVFAIDTKSWPEDKRTNEFLYAKELDSMIGPVFHSQVMEVARSSYEEDLSDIHSRAFKNFKNLCTHVYKLFGHGGVEPKTLEQTAELNFEDMLVKHAKDPWIFELITSWHFKATYKSGELTLWLNGIGKTYQVDLSSPLWDNHEKDKVVSNFSKYKDSF